MNIVIVGLGLIGGSIAKALSYSGNHRVFAIDNKEDVLLDAMSMGIIAGPASDRELENADVIYLCLYPEDAVNFVMAKAKRINPKAVLTDVCGIKAALYSRLISLAEENGFSYVGSHPMAGKEQSSFYMSDGALFRGASYIIVGSGKYVQAEQLLKGLAVEMGFGSIVTAGPQDHDRLVAFTSQLPHLLACAYVMSPSCKEHKGFSAGSYRDVSRVAKINEKLWTELFLSNRKSLLEETDILIESLLKLRKAVDENNSAELEGLLKKAREIKELDG